MIVHPGLARTDSNFRNGLGLEFWLLPVQGCGSVTLLSISGPTSRSVRVKLALCKERSRHKQLNADFGRQTVRIWKAIRSNSAETTLQYPCAGQARRRRERGWSLGELPTHGVFCGFGKPGPAFACRCPANGGADQYRDSGASRPTGPKDPRNPDCCCRLSHQDGKAGLWPEFGQARPSARKKGQSGLSGRQAELWTHRPGAVTRRVSRRSVPPSARWPADRPLRRSIP